MVHLSNERRNVNFEMNAFLPVELKKASSATSSVRSRVTLPAVGYVPQKPFKTTPSSLPPDADSAGGAHARTRAPKHGSPKRSRHTDTPHGHATRTRNTARAETEFPNGGHGNDYRREHATASTNETGFTQTHRCCHTHTHTRVGGFLERSTLRRVYIPPSHLS